MVSYSFLNESPILANASFTSLKDLLPKLGIGINSRAVLLIKSATVCILLHLREFIDLTGKLSDEIGALINSSS